LDHTHNVRPVPVPPPFAADLRGRRKIDLDAKLAHLNAVSRDDLIPYWVEAYGRQPPKGLSKRILLYAAAYHVQTLTYGELSASTKKKLRQIKTDHDCKRTAEQGGKTPLRVGTRLIREWHGKTHAVDVIEDGYLYDFTTYRSLSEIARLITGTRWSCPRFFVL
jgi:hypothetical protein